MTLNYYKRCRWVESHSQEYIRVESCFDNSFDELSPILITGIVEMSPTLISRIYQCNQETPHEGWLANLHYLTAFNLKIVIYMLRNMIGLWQEFKKLWERWNLQLCTFAIGHTLRAAWWLAISESILILGDARSSSN